MKTRMLTQRGEGGVLITPEYLRQQAAMTAGLDRDTQDALRAAAREIERLECLTRVCQTCNDTGSKK